MHSLFSSAVWWFSVLLWVRPPLSFSLVSEGVVAVTVLGSGSFPMDVLGAGSLSHLAPLEDFLEQQQTVSDVVGDDEWPHEVAHHTELYVDDGEE